LSAGACPFFSESTPEAFAGIASPVGGPDTLAMSDIVEGHYLTDVDTAYTEVWDLVTRVHRVERVNTVDLNPDLSDPEFHGERLYTGSSRPGQGNTAVLAQEDLLRSI
jgi:hypothetical protein